MAGDWIKLETATPDKPEVAILASLLNVSHADAFLSIVRVLIWADKNVSDGNVPLLSPKNRTMSLKIMDTMSHALSGTCEALACDSIGWLTDGQDCITFSNWSNHNGTSSKTRAYEAKRKASQRSMSQKCPKNVPDISDKTGTREEKRREEKNKEREKKEDHPLAEENKKQETVTRDMFDPRTPLTPDQEREAAELTGFRTVSGLADEIFYAYPLRTKKGLMVEAYERAMQKLFLSGYSDVTGHAFLLDKVKQFASSPAGKEATPDFRIPPSKWLDEERWSDDPKAWQKPNGRVAESKFEPPKPKITPLPPKTPKGTP